MGNQAKNKLTSKSNPEATARSHEANGKTDWISVVRSAKKQSANETRRNSGRFTWGEIIRASRA